MKKKCGLLGRKLPHSYSPKIHRELGDYEYNLYEVEPEELESFIKTADYDALNVTVPYKTAVIPYLDTLTDTAKKIGSVNTVIRRSDGTLLGDNTDYYGFSYMLRHGGINVKGKKALVLGSGGSSRTVCTALSDMGASSVTVISRSGKDNYDNIEKHSDANVIVNTTPVGMYPNVNESPISLDIFKKLEAVADIVYNPAVTELLYLANKRGVRTVGGISMLVAQAKAASELFTQGHIDESEIERITSLIRFECENIVLIGMPGCGKTTVGKEIARILGREFVDIDAEIVKRRGKDIPTIFKEEGEDTFRRYEHEAICDILSRSCLVISCGGGAPTKENNKKHIRQNSRVVFLKRKISELSRGGRPLSENADLEKMYRERFVHYNSVKDIDAELLKTPRQTAEAIIEELKGNYK